jgi:hypothetical protein
MMGFVIPEDVDIPDLFFSGDHLRDMRIPFVNLSNQVWKERYSMHR